MKKTIILLFSLMGIISSIQAQAVFAVGDIHLKSKTYEWPTDPAVLEKLNKWQDLKFGIMFHWGIYSIPGIAESWLLCSEDRFSERRKRVSNGMNYEEFKQWYWNLNRLFNPVKFEPGQWADIMYDAGCKYLIFTTKHHDGFCMYDTKLTDYKVTNTPYKKGKYSNVAYHVFDAFRQKGFMIGAYFSKPDFHNTDYWDPFWATPDRNPNYPLDKYPQKWENFKKFTAGQIDELMSNYGTIDILWLDGGQVRPPKFDIGIDKIIDNARQKQPGLLAVDRTIPGRNENYQTPEQSIPKEQLSNPWESCLTLGKTWGWSPHTTYKSATWVINTLAEIVAKGGCLALNVGPTPQGCIEEEAIEILKDTGNWLRRNGEAIYGTRTTPNYHSGNTWFTANKDGKTIYAIYTLPEGEELPKTIEWKGNIPHGKITLLQNGKQIKYRCQDGKVTITVPHGIKKETLAFKFRIQ